MSRKYADVQINGLHMSLSKLFDKKVVDVACHITKEFGKPVVKIDKILFEGGGQVHVGGEHDIAYVETWHGDLQYDQEEIQNLYDEKDE